MIDILTRGILKELAQEIGKEYCDSFCAGWNLAGCGKSFAYVEELEDKNREFYIKRGEYELINCGMTDGWTARHELFGNS